MQCYVLVNVIDNVRVSVIDITLVITLFNILANFLVVILGKLIPTNLNKTFSINNI